MFQTRAAVIQVTCLLPWLRVGFAMRKGTTSSQAKARLLQNYKMKILKSLKRKLKIKLSLMQEKRRRKSGSLYPRYVPQHLSQIDLGEELIRAPSITSLQNHFPRVPSLISQLSSSSSTDYTERESSGELFTNDSCFSSLGSEQSQTNDEGFCAFNQRFLFPLKTGQNVQLSELELRADSTLNGIVRVANLAYNKTVFIRWTTDNWISCQDTRANYCYSSEQYTHDSFTFTLDVSLPVRGHDGVCVELAIGYQVNNALYWDNNQGENFQILCN